MASNVLPLFWHLASSSRDTRIAAGADLVAAAEAFQAAHKPSANGINKASDGDDEDDDDDDDDEEEDEDEEDEDDDDDDDDMDVDGEGKPRANAEARALDIALARDNAPDVVYCVKRLVRGLASSRDSSRLGFAVALTELLARTPSVTAAEVLSLLERASPWSSGKGAEERDAMFARLFGVVAISDSGALFRSSAKKADFGAVVDSLLALGNAKAWLAEAAGWALLRTVRGLLASKVTWRADVLGTMIDKVYAEDKSWTPEKVALTVVLQSSPNAGEHDWKSLTSPTFRTAPLLSQPNLVALGRVLKEGGDSTGAGGAYTPKLHYVWDVILDAYFNRAKGEAAPPAPFADVFRVVVDEALFANTSSAERKYWGFQVFTRALPLLPADEVPLLFTPNFMRCWMNNLGSADRHLHRAALAAARAVQEHVRAHPAAGFPLLAQLVGRHGRPDFDRVTRTRTVETITASLTPDGVGKYVEYLEGVLLGRDDAGGSDAAGASTEERRAWALDQMAALCRNGAVPKADAWVTRVLDDLLVAGFFLVRKADKKSKIAALRAVPKPPLTEATEAAARARFFSALVDVTAAAAAPKSADKDAVSADVDAGADKWLAHALDMVRELEADPHTEVATDADDEIKNVRKRALATLSALRGKSEAEPTTRGIRLLVSFLLLQTYDDAEDALDMLDEVVGAAQALYPDKKAKRKSQGGDDDAPPPMDALLDVLIALLDKGSADLRTLANLVFGMLAPAMTASSIEHLVAQLEQSGAAEESDGGDGEDEEEDDDNDDEEDDDDDEDEEDGSDSSDSDSDADSDSADSDANATVDPEFRRRVAEALKVSGALDERDGDDGSDGSDADSDSDESVWDDDQMMKVDEQLAAVFKQHAGNKAKKSLKHAAIESVHFKNRVLDFIDAFLRRPGPLALELVMPLLRVVRGGGELGNKAAGIVRARLGRGTASHTSSVVAGEDASIDSARAAAILAEVHALARRAPSAEYSALCSSASLFAARFAPEAALATYAATLDDFIRRKHSGVQPAFIAEYVRRYPGRAWALADALASAGDVSSADTANAYRLVTAYTLLGQLLAHAPALVRAGDLSRADAEAVLARTMKGVYDTLERAAAAGDGPEAGFKADRLKALGKFALSVARTARTLATDAGADAAAAAASAAEVCDAPRLATVTAAVKDGRTRDMKGVHALLAQLAAVLAAKPQKTQQAKDGKKESKVKSKSKDAAGADVPKKKDGKKEGKSKAKTAGADESAPTSKKRKAPPSDKPKAAKKSKA